MCVCVCARVGMEGVQAMRRPSPSPTHRCCLFQVPQKKTTRCRKTLLVSRQPQGWSTEPQATRPTGVVHGCACARAQRTLTHDTVGAAFAHVCLCYACVMYTQPHSSSSDGSPPHKGGASLIAQLGKTLPAMQETLVRFLGRTDSLEKGKATRSRILAWRIPWTV